MEPTANIALRAARSAGDIIVAAADRLDLVKIEEKEKNDFVTNIDKAAEEAVIEQIRKAYPDDDIISEECGLLKGKPGTDTTWYIDPLDGTTNFIRGIPHYAISIGCLKNQRLEHAVVYDPVRREEFVASRGKGASLNGRRIRVSNATQFSGSLLGTGIPYRASQQPYVGGYMKCIEHFSVNGSGIRRAGAAALDLAYVAAGRMDAFWEYGLKPWDVAAGMLLIREAGGLVADFSGGESSLQSGNIVCGAPKLFRALLKVINQNLGQVEQG